MRSGPTAIERRAPLFAVPGLSLAGCPFQPIRQVAFRYHWPDAAPASQPDRPLNPQFARGIALALAAVVLWGAQFPVAKSALGVMDPWHVNAIRYALPAAFLLAWLGLSEGPAALRFYGKLPAAIVIGLVGMFGSPTLVYLGLTYTRPEHAAVIVALQPSMTALADWTVRGRRPGGFTIAAIAVAFAGVVAVVTKGRLALDVSGREPTGDLLVLAGAACWVVYTMATEHFRGWSALRFTVLTMVPGAVAIVALAALLAAAGQVTTPTWAEAASVGWELAYLALGGVLVAMICWNAGNQRIGALNAMLLLNLIPVVTFAIRFLQGHRFEPVELLGAAVVVAALMANNLYLRASRRAAC